MRIVAGVWRGRRLVSPKGDGTRPTSDRVREALFSSLAARLGADLGAGPVLDLFAGSGALGLEALSRGASRAVLVEKDRSAQLAIAQNVAHMEAAERVKVVGADALGPALDRVAKMGPFVLLFVDPPYRIDQAKVARGLTRLGRAGGLAFGAPVAWEHLSGSKVPEPEGFAIERTYKYGDTAVTLLRFYEGEDA
jgi:16S rRNA (guanine966-N2)-methyltransferase